MSRRFSPAKAFQPLLISPPPGCSVRCIPLPLCGGVHYEIDFEQVHGPLVTLHDADYEYACRFARHYFNLFLRRRITSRAA